MFHPFPDPDSVRRHLNGRPALTRFAPSPTGYLHLGHVVNAIYVWGMARALGGRVILRIEDHDRQRSRPEYEQAIHEDLAWLGFEADLGSAAEFAMDPCAYRQSDCEGAYLRALETLSERAPVYACDCSRKDIQSRTNETNAEELRYDGFCRERDLPWGDGTGLRLRLREEEVRFYDVLNGPQVQAPARQCGDLLLRDRHGQWTYQFAVTADDVRQGVNLIIRGMDILESTARQLLLGRLWQPGFDPVYLHHPLLTDVSGRKLSKRDFDGDIHERHLAGEDPHKVLGEAAALAGLIPRAEPIRAKELGELFAHRGSKP